ncbi:DUF3040 domain-containing protein [Actinoplanes sp. ATCC 53533]|uniref:DUF3040 domain-containing protein n=1 Tax=Actinoplanes sp. ATCC 53533 TaxID=1288362 RepID=UPI0013159BC0|nr:DUF3040 domain-containing protein [Actinoplanes sp. ATCC 53533]
MLSDAEQRRLTEIERGLRSEDPEFADRFGHAMQSRPHKWRGMTPRTWLIAAVLIMGLAVLMTSLGVALIAVAVAGVSAAIWITDHTRWTDNRRPPQP